MSMFELLVGEMVRVDTVYNWLIPLRCNNIFK